MKDQPACLVLTRQALPTFDRSLYASAPGAYIMADARDGLPEVILIGTGSEVSVCVAAFQTLKAQSVAARVGLMQAYAEGFDILRNKTSEDLPEEERYTLDLGDIAEVWRRGSVIASWLLDLGAAALVKDGALDAYSGYVQDSGEGRWTVEAAIEEAVPVYVLSTALYARFRSRQDHTFADRMLSAMRFGFGGHIEGAEATDPEPKSMGSPRR